MIPIEVKNTALTQQIVVTFSVRERCENCEFRQIQIYLAKEVNEAFDIVFCLIIKAKEDGAFHSDAIIVVTFHTFLDII